MFAPDTFFCILSQTCLQSYQKYLHLFPKYFALGSGILHSCLIVLQQEWVFFHWCTVRTLVIGFAQNVFGTSTKFLGCSANFCHLWTNTFLGCGRKTWHIFCWPWAKILVAGFKNQRKYISCPRRQSPNLILCFSSMARWYADGARSRHECVNRTAAVGEALADAFVLVLTAVTPRLHRGSLGSSSLSRAATTQPWEKLDLDNFSICFPHKKSCGYSTELQAGCCSVSSKLGKAHSFRPFAPPPK